MITITNVLFLDRSDGDVDLSCRFTAFVVIVEGIVAVQEASMKKYCLSMMGGSARWEQTIVALQNQAKGKIAKAFLSSIRPASFIPKRKRIS